jgi:NAD(P)-dependent dehydrogenase (short-subunit alcohol dehydrogenase family)
MRDIASATVLVTGATDGLGRVVAEDLARMGAEVLVHGRDEAKTERVVREIREAAGTPRVQGRLADLADLAQVRELARGVDKLDVLVNNAGVIAPERRLSADGHELTLAVNHLAGFVLALQLVPVLERNAPARIVNVASAGQEALDFDDLMLERGWQAYRAYARSKLAQILFTFELAGRLAGTGVTVNALHPASLMDTPMVRGYFGRTMSTVREGADAVVRLVADPALEGVSGRYFDGQRESRPDRQASDPDARRRLWEASEALAGG